MKQFTLLPKSAKENTRSTKVRISPHAAILTFGDYPAARQQAKHGTYAVCLMATDFDLD